MSKMQRTKGANYERTICKIISGSLCRTFVRTPRSGAMATAANVESLAGDLMPQDQADFSLHLECKNQKTWSCKAWYRQAKADAPAGKIPVVVMHQHQEAGLPAEEFVLLKLEDFLRILKGDV
jgi:hypothetical protein